jgi:hypothetical protein
LSLSVPRHWNAEQSADRPCPQQPNCNVQRDIHGILASSVRHLRRALRPCPTPR